MCMRNCAAGGPPARQYIAIGHISLPNGCCQQRIDHFFIYRPFGMASLREAALVAAGPAVSGMDATQLPRELIDAHRETWERYSACRHCWLLNRNMRCPLDVHCESGRYARKAAFYGRIECLEFTRRTRRYPWGASVTEEAARGGNLVCLAYAHDHGCPWNSDTSEAAAQWGHVDCLQYAHDNGCPWDEHTTWLAAYGGHVDCLEYAHLNGCPWNAETTRVAASSGHLDCLVYLHRNDCPWHPETTKAAAAMGHLDCLEYAHCNGCPWDPATTRAAAAGGHLDCLKYAHQHGCPWHPETARDAAWGRDKKCLTYARRRDIAASRGAAYTRRFYDLRRFFCLV